MSRARVCLAKGDDSLCLVWGAGQGWWCSAKLRTTLCIAVQLHLPPSSCSVRSHASQYALTRLAVRTTASKLVKTRNHPSAPIRHALPWSLAPPPGLECLTLAASRLPASPPPASHHLCCTLGPLALPCICSRRAKKTAGPARVRASELLERGGSCLPACARPCTERTLRPWLVAGVRWTPLSLSHSPARATTPTTARRWTTPCW